MEGYQGRGSPLPFPLTRLPILLPPCSCTHPPTHPRTHAPTHPPGHLFLPCSATTHTDLELRARSRGIPVKVIHNASIMNAVGACGLQLYRYGEAVSIVFFTGESPTGPVFL
jgi:hypothetical protein